MECRGKKSLYKVSVSEQKFSRFQVVYVFDYFWKEH